MIMVLGFCFIWATGFPSTDGIDYKALHKSFTSFTKDEFCSGNHHVEVNPKYIPQLIEYLKYCTALSRQPYVDGYARRQALVHILNSATPVIHKAFFDTKTGLKQVVLFTKLKREAIQYANYADKYGDHSMYSRKRFFTGEGTLTYAPEDDSGSYNLSEDLSLCSSILNHQQNTTVKNIIKSSKLPRVASAARIITFPPFNLSVGVSSDDTPYMILDMYVLAMRCLSFTNLQPNTTMQVTENLISHLKKKVMPFVPPHEFEKAYSGMMSFPKHIGKPVIGVINKSALSTPTLKRNSDVPKSQEPVVLRLHYNTDRGNSSDAIGGNRGSEIRVAVSPGISSNTKQSLAKAFLSYLRGKNSHLNKTLVSDRVYHEQPNNSKALIIISSILAACGTLAIILYCLLFGCCGWLTVSTADEEHDEVDTCLEGYARLDPNKQSKCYCTLADSNQMDVIAALHQRCELLSKKICEVVREISKENIFEDPASMEVLREFVRSVSNNMVGDNETIYHFGKSMSDLINPQSKI